MERAQAYQTLNLHPSADGQMVADAYWRLVRSAQADGDSAAAHDTIERLNDAYTTLTPKLSSRPGVQRSAAAQQVTLGVHYLSDVVGGWIFAIGWFIATAAAFRIWRKRVEPYTETGALDPAGSERLVKS